jgi:hypothetical protein
MINFLDLYLKWAIYQVLLDLLLLHILHYYHYF